MGIKMYVLRYERDYAHKCELTHAKILYATNLLKKFRTTYFCGSLIPDEGFVSTENNYPSLIQGPVLWCSTRDQSLTCRQSLLNIPLICVDNPISKDL